MMPSSGRDVQSELNALVHGIPAFSSWTHANKIRLFAWFLHTAQKKDRFSSGDIGECYDTLHLEKPTSIPPFLKSMEKRSPKEILRDNDGYLLERRVRQGYDQKYGKRDIAVQVTNLLLELPDRVPDLAEKDFLKEALICYRHGAFRAAIVMCWNLAYFHLCWHILKHGLGQFNQHYPVRYPEKHKKAKVPLIARYDDFSVDLKESEVIEICKSATLITNEEYKILNEKLGRRNSAAHPSSIHISQLQAEAVIDDLVRNIILALPT